MWYFNPKEYEEMKDYPFYITGIGQHDRQPYIEKPDGHPRFQFFFGTKGSGMLRIGNREIPLPEGTGFFLPPGIPHCYYPLGKEWDLRWLSCGGTGVERYVNTLGLEPGKPFPAERPEVLDDILKSMRAELIRETFSGRIFACQKVGNFILEFAAEAGCLGTDRDRKKRKSGNPRLQTVLEYIDYRFMEQITLRELCDLISVSPQHLCRMFKTEVGMRPTEYMNGVRLRKAAEMLRGTGETVDMIAYRCGFLNSNYFCKCFRAMFHMTPTEYRKTDR